MKIFDMHVHANNTPPSPSDLIEKMNKAGVFGGCVFSNCPKEYGTEGTSFEERLEEVFSWTRGYEDRLFPVLWIHPYEENIMEKVKIAKERGIVAIKIICNNFYIYEEKPMALLQYIADIGLPVIFHSGILWDGKDSSKYNRPLNFESLITIKNLRFSLGHCSWPWVDECIALYGKFLNGLTNGNSAEMFFDITPGTPPIYRKELLQKLLTVGYDVPDNIIFGTDSSAECYKPEWAGAWVKRDNEIYDLLGVGDSIKNKIYCDNLLRFLGKREKDFIHLSPVPDNANTWNITLKR